MSTRNEKLLHAIDYLEQLGEYDNALILREILDGEALPEGAWAFQSQVVTQALEDFSSWEVFTTRMPGAFGQSWVFSEGTLPVPVNFHIFDVLPFDEHNPSGSPYRPPQNPLPPPRVEQQSPMREYFPSLWGLRMSGTTIPTISIDPEAERIVEDYIAEHAPKQTRRKL